MPVADQLTRGAFLGGWRLMAIGARADGVPVEQDLDGADVAGEVPGLGVGPGQRVRGDLRVVLGGGR
ncbi:MAG: hypothetical protein ACRDRJ_38360, partial [Streptosporangiaceae bacterium]